MKMTSFLVMGAAVMLSTLSLIAPAQAASGSAIANVQNILISADSRWGGCMAHLSVNIQSILPGCPNNGWVTFSCSGDFTDPVRAYRMLDLAELAYATSSRVRVWFQDDKKHSGYCFANRIDMFP